MVRLNKETAIGLLGILLYLRDSGRTFEKVATEYIYNNYYRREDHNLDGLGPVIRNALSNYYQWHGTEVKLSNQDLIEALIKQLGATNSDEYATLVDKIAGILQSPYARNSLTGSTLNQLREALLVPTELNGLFTRLAQKELACAGCGHEFRDGEAVSVDTDERGGTSFLCRSCAPVVRTRCSHCQGHADLPKKIYTSMKTGYACDDCLVKMGKKEAPAPATTTMPVHEGFRAAARGVQITGLPRAGRYGGRAPTTTPPPPPNVNADADAAVSRWARNLGVPRPPADNGNPFEPVVGGGGQMPAAPVGYRYVDEPEGVRLEANPWAPSVDDLVASINEQGVPLTDYLDEPGGGN